MIRLISYSETQKALTCQAQWDFRYGGTLAGDALRSRTIVPRLSGGRAWGAAVAAFHGGLDPLEALDASLERDADEQRESNLYHPDAHQELRSHLVGVLDHYKASAPPLRTEQPERELIVPLPSRSGRGHSSKYRLQLFIDGLTFDADGRPWLVEYKLRDTLMAVANIELSRQIRYYAWGFREAAELDIAGVLTDERLNVIPKPPRTVKATKNRNPLGNGRFPSHAKDQVCTVESYVALCAEYGVEPSVETQETLRQRKWQQRVPIRFRKGELDEAGRELVSAAKLVGLLDRGDLYPVRNSRPANCNGCDFKAICAAPDTGLVDALFERVPAKRDRDLEAAA